MGIGLGDRRNGKGSVSIGTKDEDEEYHNYYFDIRFTKGCKDQEPEEAGKHTLYIKDAFTTLKNFPSVNKSNCEQLDSLLYYRLAKYSNNSYHIC